MNVKQMMASGLYIAFVFFQTDFTNGFLFNKKNRDITNAIITASFSPLFDKWIKDLTETPVAPVTNILEVVEYPEITGGKAGGYYLPEREIIHKLPTPFSLKNYIYKLDTTARGHPSPHPATLSSSVPPTLSSSISPIPDIIESIKETNPPVDFTTSSYEISLTPPTEIVSINEPPIYDPPIYDIINSVNPPIHLKPDIETFTNNEIVYYIIKKDPALISNNDFSLKLNNYEGIFLVTGEVLIIILLFSILTELQKFSVIQRNNLENLP